MRILVLKKAWPTRLTNACPPACVTVSGTAREARTSYRIASPGWVRNSDCASSAVRKSPGTNSPRVVDEEAAVGVPVPGDPEVGTALAHLLDDEAPVLLQQRVGFVVGEVPIGGPVGLRQLQPQPLQQRPHHRPGHAVGAVDDDLQRPARPDHLGVDEAQRRSLELAVQVHLLDHARRSGATIGRPRPAAGVLLRFDLHADVLDALVAGQRERPLAHQLHARVGLRVVRGRTHQPAVQRPRAHQVVDHLAAHQPGVEHVHALRHHPGAVAGGKLRGGQAHVVAHPDPQLGGGLAGQPPEHAHEGAPDQLGQVGVDLLAVQAPDVVGLEDLRVHGGAHAAILCPGAPHARGARAPARALDAPQRRPGNTLEPCQVIPSGHPSSTRRRSWTRAGEPPSRSSRGPSRWPRATAAATRSATRRSSSRSARPRKPRCRRTTSSVRSPRGPAAESTPTVSRASCMRATAPAGWRCWWRL